VFQDQGALWFYLIRESANRLFNRSAPRYGPVLSHFKDRPIGARSSINVQCTNDGNPYIILHFGVNLHDPVLMSYLNVTSRVLKFACSNAAYR